MENMIETFRSKQFGDVRIALINGEPWFITVDVCKALGIADATKAMERLDDDEGTRIKIAHPQNPQKVMEINAVNEPGLYALVLSSRKPEAKAFKRWVTHEVLPIIRKTGGYMTDTLIQRIQNDPAVIYEFADALLAERKRTMALSQELDRAKPKADYFDAFVNPDDCTNIRTTAKELNIPERQFVKFLLTEKFLFRSRSGQLLPYNKPSNKGLFIVRDYITYSFVSSQTFFTPKGKDTIRLKYLKKYGDSPVFTPRTC